MLTTHRQDWTFLLQGKLEIFFFFDPRRKGSELVSFCRYVNRKGVALPTSSEETKRAKRENLEQKQILVPELCTVHPFPASLWRKAVCLPCILYRINALLLADQVRRQVAWDIGLGVQEVDEGERQPEPSRRASSCSYSLKVTVVAFLRNGTVNAQPHCSFKFALLRYRLLWCE